VWRENTFVVHPQCLEENQEGMKRTIVALAVALLSATVAAAQDIPAGTLLPVALVGTLRAGEVKANDRVTAKLAQYAVLNDSRVPRGTEVSGRVVESRPASPGSPARLALRFDSIRRNGRDIPITTSLRAMASMQAVFEAQLPMNMVDDYGSSIRDWNTTQVGGQAVYRGNGFVMEGDDVVAHASTVGEVVGKPRTWPWSTCARDAVLNTEQSFWVFSTDACGVYGFGDAKLTHAGRTVPVGEITLESPGKLELRGGSGLLLVVISTGQPSSAARLWPQSSFLG
jgi:hypothetical protein